MASGGHLRAQLPDLAHLDAIDAALDAGQLRRPLHRVVDRAGFDHVVAAKVLGDVGERSIGHDAALGDGLGGRERVERIAAQHGAGVDEVLGEGEVVLGERLALLLAELGGIVAVDEQHESGHVGPSCEVGLAGWVPGRRTTSRQIDTLPRVFSFVAYNRRMARISFLERGFGEHVDWALLRTDMAVGMGALSEAVYGNTRLPVREREAARWTIALINDCAVC